MNRDGFRQMMQLVRKRKISKIIVYKLDRVSRSLSDFIKILQEFKEYKVEFVSSQESFDASSPYKEMLVKLLMVFAEFERTSIISRVTQAYARQSEMAFIWADGGPMGSSWHPLSCIMSGRRSCPPSPLRRSKYSISTEPMPRKICPCGGCLKSWRPKTAALPAEIHGLPQRFPRY